LQFTSGIGGLAAIDQAIDGSEESPTASAFAIGNGQIASNRSLSLTSL
jgi:hypothetical protein